MSKNKEKRVKDKAALSTTWDHEATRMAFARDRNKMIREHIFWRKIEKTGGILKGFKSNRIEIKTNVQDARFYMEGDVSFLWARQEFGEFTMNILGGPSNVIYERLLAIDMSIGSLTNEHKVVSKADPDLIEDRILGHHMHIYEKERGSNYAKGFDFDKKTLADPAKGWLRALNWALRVWGIIPLHPSLWGVSSVEAAMAKMAKKPLPLSDLWEGK